MEQTIVGLVAVSGSALAVTPSCGDVIDSSHAIVEPGGVVNFDSNLTGCAASPALTFIGRLNVNMNGHKLKCAGNPDVGILMEGNRVYLHDGSVIDCGGNGISDAGIVAADDGHHRIDRMLVKGSDRHGVLIDSVLNIVKNTRSINNAGNGIRILGTRNDLFNSTANKNKIGFVTIGDRNKLTNNVVKKNINDGMRVKGNQNKVVDNEVTKNGRNGILVGPGDDNRVSGNTASNNTDDGIKVKAETFDPATTTINTRIINNDAMNNGSNVDLRDESPDCGSSLWKLNTFDDAIPTPSTSGILGCI